MKTIHVPIKGNSYDVIIGKGLLNNIEDHIDTSREYVIITDNNIPKDYITFITDKCTVNGIYVIAPGEQSKSMETANLVLNQLVDDGVSRSTTIIALGGGVVGDLAGFVASTYMRGVGFIQIPTSLLSQVDSSVGGKVGINAANMKNAIGSFYQPEIVLIDPNTLNTLEERHFNNGVAEIIKHGLIAGEALFEDLENLDIKENIENIIYQSITIKKNIVIQDVKDKGIRNLLNFGHTIGHALEQNSNYELLHGEAISIGMQIISKGYDYEQRLRQLLIKHNLLIDYEYNKDIIYNLIKTDKKIHNDILNMVLVKKLGDGFIKEIRVEEIKSYL